MKTAIPAPSELFRCWLREATLQIDVINLDRSKDRLAEFMATNSHLTDVSRFPAIDGQTLDISALVRRGLVSDGILSKDYYSIGAVGAALSHIALWDSAIKTNKILTIAEDDVIFHSRFESHVPEILQTLPSDWDLISWGWNFDLFLCFEMLAGISIALSQFEQERLRANIGRFQTQTISPRPFKLHWAFGTPCYSITPKGARALKSNCLPLGPTIASFPAAMRVPPHASHFRNVGIDSAMNSAYSKLSAHVCFPPLVVTKNERSKSTIQEKSP